MPTLQVDTGYMAQAIITKQNAVMQLFLIFFSQSLLVHFLFSNVRLVLQPQSISDQLPRIWNKPYPHTPKISTAYGKNAPLIANGA